jgi:hypothetical protein
MLLAPPLPLLDDVVSLVLGSLTAPVRVRGARTTPRARTARTPCAPPLAVTRRPCPCFIAIAIAVVVVVVVVVVVGTPPIATTCLHYAIRRDAATDTDINACFQLRVSSSSSSSSSSFVLASASRCGVRCA